MQKYNKSTSLSVCVVIPDQVDWLNIIFLKRLSVMQKYNKSTSLTTFNFKKNHRSGSAVRQGA